MSAGLGRDGFRAEVEARNEQSDLDLDLARWIALAEHALDTEGVRGDAELSLLFVDETTIAGLNAEYMGKTGPTDVLAFPIDDDPAQRGRLPDSGSSGPPREHEVILDLPALLGDVVVCPAVAARQAPEHGATVDAELALLVVHGVLHVLGHDHAEPAETEAMQARERHILATFASIDR